MSNHCLIEIGTEELPPRALQSLSRDFADLVQKGLASAELDPQAIEVFATPRRLALPVGRKRAPELPQATGWYNLSRVA